MKIISENLENIEELIKFLNRKIEKLKDKNILSTNDFKKLKIFYDDIIIPWTENYYFSKKFTLTKEEENEMYNIILDIINDLDKIKKIIKEIASTKSWIPGKYYKGYGKVIYVNNIDKKTVEVTFDDDEKVTFELDGWGNWVEIEN